MLPFPGSADALCADCEDALGSAQPAFDLLAVTGASNVTGEVWPLARLADIAHRHGARLFVDGAQLAPHRPVDMAAAGIDFVALSGHKLYAPFGAGALVGPVSRLGDAAPLLHGGGAIKLVSLDDVIWADAPERHEAGSPNVVGVVALGAACRALAALGMTAVAEHERALADRLRRGLATVAASSSWCCGRATTSTGSASRASRCPGTGIRCSRRSSAPSTRSAFATAASARTRSSLACSASPTPRSAGSTPSCGRAAVRRCPARCEQASGSVPPTRTSTC